MIVPLSILTSFAAASELALYWGQASAGHQDSLGSYCQNSAGDIYIISFIEQFGSGLTTSMNVAGQAGPISSLSVPSIGEDIKTCQQLGKKVLISLGGAAGSYGFNSDSNAQEVAHELWNAFGGGSGVNRPFGDAKIDGFDLDGENMMYATEYIAFINELRALYATDSSKQYYTSAAPQCPFPDASTGQAIAGAHMDFLFIQFYNNYCNLINPNFNFDTWQNFASTQSPNKDVKLYVGLAGSPTAAGSGYATIDEIKAKLPEFSASPNFAGFMAWDASQVNSNIVNGVSFGEQLAALGGGSQVASSAAAPVAASTSTSSTVWWTPTPESTTSTSTSAKETSTEATSTEETSSSTSSIVWWTPTPETTTSSSAEETSTASTSTEETSSSTSTSSTVWWTPTPESTTSTSTSAKETSTEATSTSTSTEETSSSSSSSTVWWTPTSESTTLTTTSAQETSEETSSSASTSTSSSSAAEASSTSSSTSSSTAEVIPTSTSSSSTVWWTPSTSASTTTSASEDKTTISDAETSTPTSTSVSATAETMSYTSFAAPTTSASTAPTSTVTVSGDSVPTEYVEFTSDGAIYIYRTTTATFYTTTW